MASTETPMPVDRPRLPGPPELLPGRPDAIVDLQTDDGAALVGGQWRYRDARVEEIDFVEVGHPDDPLGPGRRAQPHLRRPPPRRGAGLRRLRLASPRARGHACCGSRTGRVCFTWYRPRVTIPERVGDLDPTGATVVFEVVVDDYAEVWVNGELPARSATAAARSSAASTHRTASCSPATRGQGRQFVIAVFGINGPISASPHNYIWMRTGDARPLRRRARGRRGAGGARARAQRARPRRHRAGDDARSSGSPAASSSPRDRCGRRTARCCSPRRTPTRSTAGRRRAR